MTDALVSLALTSVVTWDNDSATIVYATTDANGVPGDYCSNGWTYNGKTTKEVVQDIVNSTNTRVAGYFATDFVKISSITCLPYFQALMVYIAFEKKWCRTSCSPGAIYTYDNNPIYTQTSYRFEGRTSLEIVPVGSTTYNNIASKILSNTSSADQGTSLYAETYVDTVARSYTNTDPSKQFITKESLHSLLEQNKILRV